MLAAARERGVTAVVMEVSSHALAMGRVGGVRFAVGGYTNFGSDHLDFHADSADYFAAKARLFDGRCGGRGAQPRRPGADAALQAGHGQLLGRRRPDRHLVGRRTSTATGYAQRFAAHGPDGLRAARRGGAARPAQRGQRAAGHRRCSSPSASTPRPPPPGVAACAGVPGRLELIDAPGRCAASSTTPTSPTPSWPRSPRCGSSPPAPAGCSAPPARPGSAGSGPSSRGSRTARRSPTRSRRRTENPSAIRAAGAANGRNPISIVIPCHRVIGADGTLTGYSGGLDAKRWLLALEGVAA